MEIGGLFAGGVITIMLVGGFFIGVVVLVVTLTSRARKRRQAANAHWAASRGWQYHTHIRGLERRWQSPPFRQGTQRTASDVFTGTFHGHDFISFTYSYVTSSGEDSTTHYHHVLAMQLPVPLPWLQLTPEGVGSTFAKFFGGQDIQFESEVFNKAWRIQGPPGQYAFDFIHPRMMDRLLQPDAVGRNITVEGRDILLWVGGSQQPANIDPYLNLLLGIIEQVPRHLWLNVGYDPLAQ